MAARRDYVASAFYLNDYGAANTELIHVLCLLRHITTIIAKLKDHPRTQHSLRNLLEGLTELMEEFCDVLG